MNDDAIVRTERQLENVRDEIERIERDGEEAEFESKGASKFLCLSEI